MATPDELQRIAQAMNALRPDWGINSLVTFLGRHHSARSARDLAIAAIVVATDPKTATPKLLNQHGPWWLAAQTVAGGTASTASGAVPGVNDARCPEHEHEHMRACRICIADRKAREDANPTAHQGAPDPEHKDMYARGARRVRAELAIHRGETP